MGSHVKSKNNLIQILMNDFRVYGFDALSLSKISESTSLGKASLYHHFPGGKEQMALEVMTAATEWINNEIITVLTSSDEPRKRLRLVLKKFNEFYECGAKPCILESLVASDAPQTVKHAARLAFEILLEGFKKLAKDLNKSNNEARQLAECTVITLQGALIVSRGMLDQNIFKRSIGRIESLFFNDNP